MNRKQLGILLIALVIVGSAGLILLKRHSESWSQPQAKTGDKVLPDFQPNAVAALHIINGSELNLVYDKELWRVRERDNYPADFHRISDVLIKLKTLKVVEADTVDPSELGRVNLAAAGSGPNGGTLVEFLDAKGQTLNTLLVGKRQTPSGELSSSPGGGRQPEGCYLLLPKAPAEVLLISDSLAMLQPDPASWLSRDFFKAEHVKSCAMAPPNPAEGWTLTRDSETSSWTLAGAKSNEVLDDSKARQIASVLSSPRFVDVLCRHSSATPGADTPTRVTIETFDNFTYNLDIGAKSPAGNYYVQVRVAAAIPTKRAVTTEEKPADKDKLDREFQDQTRKLQEKLKQEQALTPWVYEIGSWILDPLLQPRSQLLQGNQVSPTVDTSVNASPSIPGYAPRVIK